MADFPAYTLLIDSEREAEEGIVDDFSQGGLQHSRIYHDSTYFRFNLLYHMTKAQYDAFVAVYDAGPRDSYTNFEYFSVSPQELYTVKFLSRPRIIRNLGGNTFMVEANIRGTAN